MPKYKEERKTRAHLEVEIDSKLNLTAGRLALSFSAFTDKARTRIQLVKYTGQLQNLPRKKTQYFILYVSHERQKPKVIKKTMTNPSNTQKRRTEWNGKERMGLWIIHT